jgi:hypothetical protein
LVDLADDGSVNGRLLRRQAAVASLTASAVAADEEHN